jgi:3,4-dihydroxy 2-butanone 4-phosphate synthase/GTP cyclohydrolase II
VICELANDDGTVMKGGQIVEFAEKHGLKRISVADMIAFRQAREKLVERLSSFPVKTEFGEFTGYVYGTAFEDVQHFAFVAGRIGDGRNVVARLHRANVVADVMGGGTTIRGALSRIAQEGRGVLVYLRDGSAGVPVTNVRDPQDGSEAERSRQWREIGLGAQILRDLGVRSIRNLATGTHAYVGLSGFGIEILGSEPV